MIKRKDVIWLYVPFPDINSGLARKRHMYNVSMKTDPVVSLSNARR